MAVCTNMSPAANVNSTATRQSMLGSVRKSLCGRLQRADHRGWLRMKQTIARQLPRFNTTSLLRTTVVFALVFATVRWLGPQYSWTLFLVCYAFAPTLAVLAMLAMRNQSPLVRYSSAILLLLFFLLSASLLCGLIYGKDAMLFAVVGALIEWPGQIAILACLRWMSGISSKMDSDANAPPGSLIAK